VKAGDGVVRVDWDGNVNPSLFGIVLEVHLDQNTLKNPFGPRWIYRVAWNDGVTKEHEMGTLRRLIAVEKASSR
jgi:hypothetical protein